MGLAPRSARRVADAVDHEFNAARSVKDRVRVGVEDDAAKARPARHTTNARLLGDKPQSPVNSLEQIAGSLRRASLDIGQDRVKLS